ncbi:hypothetical protein GH5_01430 [Leishmania sp. Ghana 2012 LV757]|uniref:hypothetical protein n=1 Tax=Leishmania sp. Ghana 2012 LV757 TaxID=2803181 RepID=UPI001B65F5BB|nr:hypothetical protein GH5_01430 [Leishmania sp. Ghana 2012 LV757]
MGMRPAKVHLCNAPVHPWASEYLARVGVAPAAIASAHSHRGASPHNAQQTDCGDTSGIDLDSLQKQYREARKQLLRALRVKPFSYENIIARASGSLPEKTVDLYDLRGLCSADYDHVAGSSALEPAARQFAHCTGTAGAQPVVSASATAVPADSGPARRDKKLGPSVTSVASAAGDAPAAAVHWPTVSQMTKAVERRIMDYRPLWRATSMLISDRLEAEKKRRALEPHTSAAEASSTLFFTGGSLPFLLATVPHALVFSVAEHAILHAWYGGPHVYPDGKAPSPTAAFVFQGGPLLRVDDVGSLQWDRAKAAYFLVAVLRQPAVQKELRQRLWGAAQNYHRGVIRKLESLAWKKGAEDVSQDACDRHLILLEQEPGMPAPLSLPLDRVRDDLFSFDERAYFFRVSPSSPYANSHQCRAQCESLRSTHLFRFVSSCADVAAAFADRPRSNVSGSLSRFSSLVAEAGPKASTAPVSLSTRDKLWLLLSEMVRVRYLVAYLLNFEFMLHQVRHSYSRSQGERPKRKEGEGAGVPEFSSSEQANMQDAENANCIAAVFHFLDIRIHPRLAVNVHHHRFLRLTRVRHREWLSAAEPHEASTAAHEATDTDMSLAPEARRYATVQELFNAFSKALGESTASPSQEPGTVASCACSVKSTGEGSGTSGDDMEARSDAQNRPCGSSGLQHVVRETMAPEGPSPLSDTDADFLEAIVSAARGGHLPHSSVQGAAERDHCGGQAKSSPVTAGQLSRSRDSPGGKGFTVGRPKASPPQASDTPRGLQPFVDVVWERESSGVKWPFRALRARTNTSILKVHLRSSRDGGSHAVTIGLQPLCTTVGGGEVKKTECAPLSRESAASLLQKYPYVTRVNDTPASEGEAVVHLFRSARVLKLRLARRPPVV